MAKATGRVIQIQGSVVDVEFPRGELPGIYEALEIPLENGGKLVLEVEKHLARTRCGVFRWIPPTVCSAGFPP